jgi:hypothetical protein
MPENLERSTQPSEAEVSFEAIEPKTISDRSWKHAKVGCEGHGSVEANLSTVNTRTVRIHTHEKWTR